MGSDIVLVAGLLLVILSVPTLISAFSGGAPMRRVVALAGVGGALVAYAAISSPVGYSVEDIPEVVMRVIAYFLR